MGIAEFDQAGPFRITGDIALHGDLTHLVGTAIGRAHRITSGINGTKHPLSLRCLAGQGKTWEARHGRNGRAYFLFHDQGLCFSNKDAQNFLTEAFPYKMIEDVFGFGWF